MSLRGDLEVLAKTVKYKPGFKFALAPDTLGLGGYLEAFFEAPDADAREEFRAYPIKLTHRKKLFIEDLQVILEKPDYFRMLVREFVWSIERHEVDEWLRFDGVKVFDPHKGEKK